jgi:DUF1680 family protein
MGAEDHPMTRAAWTPVAHTAWTISDPFWAPRRATLFATTLASQHTQLRESGRLSRLGIMPADPGRAGSHIFYDSDTAKWLEAAAYALAERPDAGLRADAEAVIAGYERIQLPDGYLNSHFCAIPERRWSNLEHDHELYCLGHLIEAAVAWQAHLGCGRLLACCRRALDHVWRRFGPDGEPAYCGHPEIELALMRLWRLTGDERARRLCRLFVDRRGRAGWFARERARGQARSDWGRDPDEFQDARPLADERHAVGHAVRCLYLACGALDLAQDEDDAPLAAAIGRIWDSATRRRMHVTGGVGSSAHRESFSSDWDLDPFRAYNETCASIALMMLAQRLLAEGPRADAGDILELALHNGVLAGWSLDGDHYLYANPLAVDPGWDGKTKHWNGRAWGREGWFGCACCPPNLARTVAQLGSYAASTRGDDLALHLLLAGGLAAGGWQLALAGDWVRGGRLLVQVQAAPAGGSLHLRLPGWSTNTRVIRDGAELPHTEPGYLRLEGLQAGSRVEVIAAMTPRRIHADPRAEALTGRVALWVGPLIYCLESCDHQHGLEALSLPEAAALSLGDPDPQLAGCRPILAEAQALKTGEGGPYRSQRPACEPARLTAVPYCLWNHRGPGAMRVWVRGG